MCIYRMVYGYKVIIGAYVCMYVASPRVIKLFSALVKLSFDQRLNNY